MLVIEHFVMNVTNISEDLIKIPGAKTRFQLNLKKKSFCYFFMSRMVNVNDFNALSKFVQI